MSVPGSPQSSEGGYGGCFTSAVERKWNFNSQLCPCPSLHLCLCLIIYLYLCPKQLEKKWNKENFINPRKLKERNGEKNQGYFFCTIESVKSGENELEY